MPKISAERILKSVWGKKGFPVDPIWIATQLEILVLEGLTPPDVRGALVKRRGESPVILLNRRNSEKRRRFTCAHELGHYVQRLVQVQGGDWDAYQFVDRRDQVVTTVEQNPDEVFANRFANRFAENLLMPEQVVRELHRDHLDIFFMQRYFGVSPETVVYRLKMLGLVGNE